MEKLSPYCPYCFSGIIVKYKSSDIFFCDVCNKRVEIKVYDSKLF